MSDASTAPAEGVTYEARLHWILFAPPLAFFVGGLAAVVFNPLAAIALLGSASLASPPPIGRS